MKILPWQSEHESIDSDSTVWLQFPSQAVFRHMCASDLQAGIRRALMSFLYRSILKCVSLLLPQPYPNNLQPADRVVSCSWQTTTGLSSTICTANGVWFVAAGEKGGLAEVVWKAVYNSLVPSRHQGYAWSLAFPRNFALQKQGLFLTQCKPSALQGEDYRAVVALTCSA